MCHDHEYHYSQINPHSMIHPKSKSCHTHVFFLTDTDLNLGIYKYHDTSNRQARFPRLHLLTGHLSTTQHRLHRSCECICQIRWPYHSATRPHKHHHPSVSIFLCQKHDFLPTRLHSNSHQAKIGFPLPNANHSATPHRRLLRFQTISLEAVFFSHGRSK